MAEVASGMVAGLGCPGEGLKWVWGVLGGIRMGLGVVSIPGVFWDGIGVSWDGIRVFWDGTGGVLGGIWVGLGWDWGGIHPRGVMGWDSGVLGWDLSVPGWAPLCALPSAPYLGGRWADVSQQLVHIPVVLEAPKKQGKFGVWDIL